MNLKQHKQKTSKYLGKQEKEYTKNIAINNNIKVKLIIAH